MTFTTIHSIGDAAFLTQILNSVVMIVGTGDYTRLVSIGLLLGVLVVVLQSLFRGAKEIPWQQLLLGWIVYACMFIPTTSVVVEDSYNGRTRTVDNVPIGVAFAGSMISNIGYGITVLFETAYHDVSSITDRSFAEPLRLTNALRQHSADVAILEKLNQSIGANTDIGKSLNNYIKDCSMPKLALRSTTATDMVTKNSLDQIAFQSNIYGTRIYIRNARGEDLTCAEAWTKMRPELEKVKDAGFIRGLSDTANLKTLDPNNGNRAADINDYQQAFDMLNMSSTEIESYLLTSIIKPIYENAATGYYKNVGDTASAIMLNQAIQQRNTQWSAEASMFATVVRPLLTFFEGFMYGVTPLMGFLLVMGGIGISLAMKYVMLILWIQLWMPVMSIVNLYIIMAARGDIAGNIQTYDSFYAVDKLGTVIEHWLATGGMLAAATPLISLFLVSGSVYAFTSLTQRMNGGDHINEKLSTPDVAQPSAFYQHASAGNGSSLLGAQRTGAEGTEGSISIDSIKSNATASALSKKEAASNGLTETLQSSWATSAGTSDSAALERRLGESLTATGSQSVQRTRDAISNTSWGKKLDDSQKDEMVGAISAMASAGWSPTQMLGGITQKLTGFNAQTSTQYATSDRESDSRTLSMSQSDQESLSKSLTTSDMSNLAKAHDSVVASSDTHQFLKSANVSDNSTVGKAFSKAAEAAKSFQQTQSSMDSIGFNGTYTSRQLAGMLNTEEGNVKMGQIATEYQGTAIESEAQAVSDRLQRFNGLDANSARKIGFISALGNSGESKDHATLSSLLGTATGMTVSPKGDANANAGIASNLSAPSAEGLAKKEEVRDAAGIAATSVPVQQGNIGNKLDHANGKVMAESSKTTAGVLGRGATVDIRDQSAAIENARTELAMPVQERAGAPKFWAAEHKDAIYEKAVGAGLTKTQAQYMTNALLGDHYNKTQGRQELFDENKALYGKTMNDKEIQSLTDDMVKHFNNASWGGANNFTNYIGPVTEWNRANTKFGENLKQK